MQKKFYFQIQLVVKQGFVEIKLTGHANDFNNATLIAKSAIEDMNVKIKVNNLINTILCYYL